MREVPLPEPGLYFYEWRSNIGIHRAFTSERWNGELPDKTIGVLSLRQCREYGDARVRTALEDAITHIRVKLIGCGRTEIIQELRKRLL